MSKTFQIQVPRSLLGTLEEMASSEKWPRYHTKGGIIVDCLCHWIRERSRQYADKELEKSIDLISLGMLARRKMEEEREWRNWLEYAANQLSQYEDYESMRSAFLVEIEQAMTNMDERRRSITEETLFPKQKKR